VCGFEQQTRPAARSFEIEPWGYRAVRSEIFMAGDSNECSQRAAQCLDLENSSDNLTLKSNFLGFATTWAKLAEELETVTVVLKDAGSHNTKKT
jgi:hypothetical protein